MKGTIDMKCPTCKDGTLGVDPVCEACWSGWLGIPIGSAKEVPVRYAPDKPFTEV